MLQSFPTAPCKLAASDWLHASGTLFRCGRLFWGTTAVGIVVGIAIGITILRAYYHPLHIIFVWPTPHGNWYSFHPVAWDDPISLPFPRLEQLLVAYAEQAPDAANQEIERLIDTYPSQRMAALKARTTLIARKAREEINLANLDDIVAKLPEGQKNFLAEVPRLRSMIHRIAQIHHQMLSQVQPLLRKPIATQL